MKKIQPARLPLRLSLRLPVLLTVLLLTGCAGCTRSSAPPYDPAGFSCTLAIDSVSAGGAGYFAGELVSDHGTAVLSVTEPASLAGLTFTFGDSGCVMDACGVCVPLSGAVSDSLASLAALVCSDPADAPEKNGTVLVYDTGRLTLDDAGYPVLAETTDGRRAEITFHNPEQNLT